MLHHAYCSKCKKPITVEFQPAGIVQSHQESHEEGWKCPHGCGLRERHMLKGHIVGVWRGHEFDSGMSKA